jgi:hypothetical protein
MVSFLDLWQAIYEQEGPDEEERDIGQEIEDTALMGVEADPSTVTGVDEKSQNAIRTGLNMSPDFWENFIKVTNNNEALGSLLNISPDKISEWGAKVKEALEEVKRQDKEPGKEIISTGEGE